MYKAFTCLLTFSAVLFAAPLARAVDDPDFTAKIYDQDSAKKTLLFTHKRVNEKKGDGHASVSTYFDPANPSVPIAIETTEFDKDGKVISYHMSQKQIDAEGQIDVAKEKINFTYTKKGDTKKAEETLTENFVVGPSIVQFLQAHWDQITKGDKVKIRFGVPDRAETVGFEFFKDRDETVTNGGTSQKTVVVKMKPSNFLIATLVQPLYFFMMPDASRLVELHGRTQLKRKVDGSFKDLDAVTVYEYAPSAVNSK